MDNKYIIVLMIVIIVFVITIGAIIIIWKKDGSQQDPIEKAENERLAKEARELGQGFKD